MVVETEVVDGKVCGNLVDEYDRVVVEKVEEKRWVTGTVGL